MCGIVAIVDSREPVPARQIDAMRAAIAHRGPDGGGTVVRQADSFTVGLGAQRLSIIDLSPAGMMPMANEDEQVWIVYNGEVYNHLDLRARLRRRGHHYRSRTDTETVLHAYEEYGTDCFGLLDGMFSCVIYDRRNDRVVFARDRTGIKPLYYRVERGRLVCASELKALAAAGVDPDDFDPVALDLYLALGYVPAPHCLIRGVQKLTAGAYGIYEAGLLRIVPYWQPSFSAGRKVAGWSEVVARTRCVVSEAVERQLMSDVPVGVMLSGGLDSTIIATIARAASSEPLHTFSIGFETRRSGLEPIYNLDREYARRVAGALGSVHHEIVVTDGPDLEPELRRLVRQLDEPVWEPSFLSIYHMSALAREHDVKVLLSGDGSDELFGGYPWHPALVRLEAIERVPGLRPAFAFLSRLPFPTSIASRARDLDRRYRHSDLDKYHAQYEVFDAATRARLFGRSREDDPLDAVIAPVLAGGSDGSLAERFALAELVLWVGDHFNQRLDRMTMAASVEGRVPFQASAVVDLALTMAVEDKLRGGVGKAPLRAAFADRLPAFVLNRAKRPFAAPAMAWMQGALRPRMLELLSARSLARLPGIDPDLVPACATRLEAGLPVRQEQLWSLFHLVLWFEEFASVARPDIQSPSLGPR